MSVSSRLRELRRKLNMTQKQLAEKVQVSPQVISNWERDYTTPDAEDIKRLADVLETSVDYILGRSSKPAFLLDKESLIHKIEDLTDPHQKTVSSSKEITPEEREFLKWVDENLESSFFYDFDRSPEDSKREMMETLRFIWEREKKRIEKDKQGD